MSGPGDVTMADSCGCVWKAVKPKGAAKAPALPQTAATEPAPTPVTGSEHEVDLIRVELRPSRLAGSRRIRGRRMLVRQSDCSRAAAHRRSIGEARRWTALTSSSSSCT